MFRSLQASRFFSTRFTALAFFLATSVLLTSVTYGTTQEKEILELTNQQRTKAGQKPLKFNDKLVEVARKQSNAMAKTGKLSHTVIGDPAARVKKQGYYAEAVAENIGQASSASEIVQIWMKSQHHKQNILSPTYKSIGIGVAIAPDGKKYYTQVFAKGAKRIKTKGKK